MEIIASAYLLGRQMIMVLGLHTELLFWSIIITYGGDHTPLKCFQTVAHPVGLCVSFTIIILNPHLHRTLNIAATKDGLEGFLSFLTSSTE